MLILYWTKPRQPKWPPCWSSWLFLSENSTFKPQKARYSLILSIGRLSQKTLSSKAPQNSTHGIIENSAEVDKRKERKRKKDSLITIRYHTSDVWSRSNRHNFNMCAKVIKLNLQKISKSIEFTRTPSSSHDISLAFGSFKMGRRGTSNGGGLCTQIIQKVKTCNWWGTIT